MIAGLINATILSVDQRRWHVTFNLRLEDGTETSYTLSADSYIADSGIWFGTTEEWKEAME